MLCKTFEVRFTRFGFILSFTSWGPYFGKSAFPWALPYTKCHQENIFVS